MANVYELLRARYPSNTHALLFEVRNDAGFSADRSCDALAMGLWPSRGLKLAGFEIKESRADWLREYRNPEKAEAFSVFCDEWWIVAGDSSIVQMDELPEKWGLLVAKGQRFQCVKQAPKNPTPMPLDRGLLAAILKRAHDQASAPVKAEFERGRAAGRKELEAQLEREKETRGRELQELRKAVYDFERASGVTIKSWNGEQIGQAVRFVLDGGHKRHELQTESMLNTAKNVVAAIEALKATFK